MYAPLWECVVCCSRLGYTPGVVPCVITSCETIAHTVCSKCAPSLKNCPFCRVPCGKILPIGAFIDEEKDPAAAVELARIVKSHPTEENSIAPRETPLPDLHFPDHSVWNFDFTAQQLEMPRERDTQRIISNEHLERDTQLSPRILSPPMGPSVEEEIRVASRQVIDAYLDRQGQLAQRRLLPLLDEEELRKARQRSSNDLERLRKVRQGTNVMRETVAEFLREIAVNKYFWRAEDRFLLMFSARNERKLFPFLQEPFNEDEHMKMADVLDQIRCKLQEIFKNLRFCVEPTRRLRSSTSYQFEWMPVRIAVFYNPVVYGEYKSEKNKSGLSYDMMHSLNLSPPSRKFDMAALANYAIIDEE